MDFIKWCHHILGALEKEKLKGYIHLHKIPTIVFSKDFIEENDFHNSDALTGLIQALQMLADFNLVDNEHQSNWRISTLGRKVLADPIIYWTEICSEELDSEEETLIKLVNKYSPRINENPEYGYLEPFNADKICLTFEIPPPAEKYKQRDDLEKYIYNLPNLLKKDGFLNVEAGNRYCTNLYPTYKGLVWDTRRDCTIESKFIDELVKDWETTNVDFKQELSLKTEKQKAEFAKDILGLANTKSSGKRYLIIGFNDKTREYHASPDTNITQEIMERHLVNLTEPMVNISYKIVNYKQNKVGKLEVIREPEKLPYRAKKDVFIDDKRNKGLEKDKVYVRHGSHTESPSETELKMLEEEGQRARGYM